MRTFFLFCIAAAIGAAQADARLVLHRTVTIDAKLTAPLNSQTAHNGERFLLLTAKTRIGSTLLPAGSLLEGHLQNVSRATSRRGGTMDLLINDVRFPNASVSPMHARLHLLSKTKSDLALKKGTPIHMQALADIPVTIVLSAAPTGKHAVLATPPTMRPYDEGEQFPF